MNQKFEIMAGTTEDITITVGKNRWIKTIIVEAYGGTMGVADVATFAMGLSEDGGFFILDVLYQVANDVDGNFHNNIPRKRYDLRELNIITNEKNLYLAHANTNALMNFKYTIVTESQYKPKR